MIVESTGVGTGGGARAPPSFLSVPCPLCMSCTTNIHTVPPHPIPLERVVVEELDQQYIGDRVLQVRL